MLQQFPGTCCKLRTVLIGWDDKISPYYLHVVGMFVYLHFRYFTWDVHKFPHSEEMVKNISAKGRKMVTIVDPHIKRDDNYFVYKEALDRDYFIKTKEGNVFEGWCWPG